jgi:hypothetical protein
MLWLSSKGTDWTPYLIYVIGIGAGLGAWAIRKTRARLAQSWPVVNGTVEYCLERIEGEGRNQRDIAEVNYSYKVDGEFYSGAHEVASAVDFVYFPKGSTVLVHHKPSDPSTSFLDLEEVRAREAAAG